MFRFAFMYALMYTKSMKIPKVQSATELRTHLFETLREVQEGDPQLITHTKGSDGVVLISQARLNAILEENDVLKAIAKGRADIKAGKFVSQKEVEGAMQEKFKQWRK